MKKFFKDLEKAIDRVEKRGNRPPWDDHPNDITVQLYVADEVSSRVRRWFDEHLEACARCRERTDQVKKLTGF